MDTYFESAKSLVLGIFLWGILLSSLGLGFYSIPKDASINEFILLGSISFIVILFVGVIWFRTGYLVSRDLIIVKIGPVIISKIKISRISKIERSNSLLASPANSLNRLAIKSGQTVLGQISPKDEESFLQLITEMNPKIHIDL